MAITPPNNNTGVITNNPSPTGPVVWDGVLPANNQIIDNDDMPFASTVEYKGYYKAESTGFHEFSLTGSTNITGYSWFSSAPRNSDHIVEDNNRIQVTSQRSYSIIIPLSRANPGSTWRFEDPDVLGTDFIGYGYWPKEGYGNSQGYNGIYAGQNTPSTECTPYQVPHQYLVPGDVRTYGGQYPTNFRGKPAGPGWQAPEDPNFAAPCYGSKSEYKTPLVRAKSTLFPDDKVDAFVVPTTQGKTNQVFLDNTFIAEGDQGVATFESVADIGGHTYIWPQPVNVRQTKAGKTKPERIRIMFGLKFPRSLFGDNDEHRFKFEWKSRDGLKMWYALNNNDSRNLIKFPDNARDSQDIIGSNPCNLNAQNTGNNGWLPGGGNDGFTGVLDIRKNSVMILHGYATGVPDDDTHGFSLRVLDEDNNEVFNTRDLLLNFETGLIGIDECGYNALLSDSSRISQNKKSEFFKSDGWMGYSNSEKTIFTADDVNGDKTERSPDTTRQYLWSNALTKVRDGQTVSGSVYLRQGDYYFIRTIVSNHQDQQANFRFTVKTPVSGLTKSVKFTGNGDPNSDTTVGGTASEGNGVPISIDTLCDSVLYNNGTAASDNTNFALITRLGVVLNLNVLGVSNEDIGKEGQIEIIDGKKIPETASKLINFNDDPDNPNQNITLTRLVRGGSNGVAELNSAQKSAVLTTYVKQLNDKTVLDIYTFRSAITSQAVVPWGDPRQSGGNYPYIYHAVSEVITSICTGVDIVAPTPLPSKSNLSNDSDQIDLNITVVEGEGALITSTAHDSCKTPDTFTRPESQYTKTKSQFTGMDNRYFNKVRIQKNYGVVSPSTWSAPGPSKYGNYDISQIAANYRSGVRFNPGEVTAVPLFVPDVFVPDEFNIDTNSQGFFDCCYKLEISSNTFDYNPNNSSEEVGVQRPYLVWWVSATPGGPKIGRYKFVRNIHTTPKFYATMSYEQFVSDSSKEPSRRALNGYLGNIYSAKWWNLAPLKYQDVQNLNFDIPEAGTTEFVDLFSTRGFKTNEIRIIGKVTSPNCNKLVSNNSNNIRGVPSSFKSAQDMIPFI
jgi:hypothetical protein